ncbi:hypothetical protein AAFF_G00332310 [Aldrovandia affinis]|uniref:Uncharacterized protein n=1 Tax=Aldrovandia affinis TaxID=143900 RepID=A0AAD7SLG5_9TELE|nr:hypothetical protein AAFF_G00332310 [Aldrovandia affinis]
MRSQSRNIEVGRPILISCGPGAESSPAWLPCAARSSSAGAPSTLRCSPYTRARRGGTAARRERRAGNRAGCLSDRRRPLGPLRLEPLSALPRICMSPAARRDRPPQTTLTSSSGAG